MRIVISLRRSRWSEAGAVEGRHLQPGQLHTRQAAHVDGHHLRTGLGVSRLAVRRDPADGAEVVADVVLVERVGRQVAFGRLQHQRLARGEPQQTTAPAAQRAVAIDDLCDKRPVYYELSVKGHLFHFFYLLFSSQGSPVIFSRSKSLDKVKQIVSYIESHYTEQITVQSAADYMGFSESHFMKFFKQHLHTTFTSYLNGYRLTIASRLLLTEDDSILSISERTGFNNLSYFNRLFKKEYQMSPREYRNR